MTPAKRYLLTLLGGACAVALLNVLLATYTQPLVGDLTRIGALSERQFGWRYAQPTLNPSSNSVPLSEADVVVIGDSFSRLGLWQGELERLSGLTTHTLLLTHGQCIDTAGLMSLPMRRGSTLIIQSVERLLAGRLTQWVECVSPSHAKDVGIALEDVGAAHRSTFAVDSDISFKARAALHDAMVLQGSYSTFGRVKVVKLRNSPFTSAADNRLLYLSDDDAPENQIQGREAEAIQNLQNLRAQLARKHVRLQFLLAPNKSSMYLGSHQNRAAIFSAQLAAAGLSGSDFMLDLQNASATQIDFYLPNDTHWGNRGYSSAAHIVSKWLERQPR